MFFGILKHPGGAACLREEYCTASAGALLAVVGRTGLRLLCYLVRSVSAGKCYFSANDCRIKVVSNRPVLKHGPRSRVVARVIGWQT